MPSQYLSQADLNTYGVPNATAAQIIEASALVDAYLKRPEGLQYMQDSSGMPCYMAGLTPSLSFTSTSSISPGKNVVVPLPGASMLSTYGQIGAVVILDRGSTSQGRVGTCEACVIGSITSTSITLNSATFAHSSNCTIEFGLTIVEQQSLPSKRSIARLSSYPIARIISGLGSYRFGRRDEQQAGLYDDRNLLSIMQTFGGPPEWNAWDVTAADFSGVTNEVWVPCGVFLAYYSDVKVFYIAGFTQANIPPVIKQVTANVIAAKINTSDMAGGIKTAKAGDSMLMRFDNTVLDADTRAQLSLYRARLFV